MNQKLTVIQLFKILNTWSQNSHFRVHTMMSLDPHPETIQYTPHAHINFF
jgi:hypothetical protein